MPDLLETLADILGQDGLLTDQESCILYAQDVLTKDEPAIAVARPADTEQLSACVKAAVAAGVDVLPRGGGMSYTSGYLPQNKGSLIIDMGRMTRVLEINTEDMYVTVEAGCTWASLYEALKESGWRTPFWGTLSGIFATVGGGVSQNSIFWGAGTYGSAVDSVVSLSIVLADGSVLNTGSAAHCKGTPWFRHFGPDLTGIFLGDCGALGFKANVTLKLVPEYPARSGLSFASDTGEAMLAFASDVSRLQLASEVCGFDPYLQAQRLKRESLGKDVKALAGVMKSAGGLGKALKAGAKVALAGRGYMKDVKFSIHTLIEERYDAVVGIKEKELRELANKHGLREIENSIPKILRANPFGPVNNMIGPEGQRWAPVHALVPHSKAAQTFQAIEATFARHQDAIEKFDIGCGYLFSSIGNNALAIEPVFFWPDELNELHHHAVEESHLQRLKGFPANPEARAAVITIRKELVALFADMGLAHLQIGKAYHYKESLRPEAWALVEALKQHVDPSGKINPGSLGLNRAD